MSILTGIFGSRNDRLIKQYRRKVSRINALEEAMQALDDEALKAKTAEFRERLEGKETLDDLLPEAFAAVREASVRTLGLRHFDVQMIGGMVLHEGNIAEMRTGEGKTLVATLPVYLNALTGDSVHVVTVNEYLARRDSRWMGPVYEALGLTVDVIHTGQDPETKRTAYACDVVYGTNNEFGFDYLRDNLAHSIEARAQGRLSFAIVDEVDSILIDEARTPLIISGPAQDNTDLFVAVDKLIPKLEPQEEEDGPGDYTIDEKQKQAYLTEDGHAHVEELMAKAGLIKEGGSLYDSRNIGLMQHLSAALRAHKLYNRDVEYIVKEGEIVIVDEFTGRTMPGRRWSDGLHQAIEAKERVQVRQETQTLASITFQNYFRMYDKLGGMTGTADTEAPEFLEIYKLEVVVIPTHRDMVRDDAPDLLYLTQNDKFEAILEDIQDCYKRGQPALVGTTSIETSELLSNFLRKSKIPHEVLNAKQHAREAEIVAQAGRPGAITIATNMAGRGTDIVLGGNLEADLINVDAEDAGAREKAEAEWKERHDKVLEAGGLHIIGTERHESRRIDNQLRGRSGRQGDPGSSRFYLALEDNLMRIFGQPERTKALLERVGMREGEAIESKMLSRQIEKAQRKVEAHNFDIRKQLLQYDDVVNEQRKVIYGQRTELMQAEDISDNIAGIREEVLANLVEQYVPMRSVQEQWDVPGLVNALDSDFKIQVNIEEWIEKDSAGPTEIRDGVVKAADEHYESKVEAHGAELMHHAEKAIMLQLLDANWKEHLAGLDYLRQGIHLRSYAQKKPEQEYKREAYQMFEAMWDRVLHDTISMLSRIRIRTEEEVEEMERRQRAATAMRMQHASASALSGGEAQALPGLGATGTDGRPAPARGPAPGPAGGGATAQPPGADHTPFVRSDRKIGRNEPCPCGSGKKYKHCHGRLS